MPGKVKLSEVGNAHWASHDKRPATACGYIEQVIHHNIDLTPTPSRQSRRQACYPATRKPVFCLRGESPPPLTYISRCAKEQPYAGISFPPAV
ncbi:hypothetical protein KCP73_05180 [Salmonella enterica subsp. enterica]|nr:hypothetical protein KCP73_05180 [Salmonella enterica subsp. enterica]